MSSEYDVRELSINNINIEKVDKGDKHFIIIQANNNSVKIQLFSETFKIFNYDYVMFRDLCIHKVNSKKLSEIFKDCIIKYQKQPNGNFKYKKMILTEESKKILKKLKHIYCISDTHFYDPTMLLTRRQFDTIDSHNNAIIKNINQTVPWYSTLDIVGDVIVSKKENEIIKIRNSINCQNVQIIRGNHDELSDEEYRKYGFDIFKESSVLVENTNIILSHQKLKLNMYGYRNVYGHDHEKAITSKSFNCSVEALNGIPRSIYEISDDMEVMNPMKIDSDIF